MVNVKKIGAIATGALFIGATFGMASAVTVPSGLSSKLASGGVAKAQLVVGADAPGKVADTDSAKDIQDAVKAKLVSTVGGDISIEFGSHDLHDNINTLDEFNLTTLTANHDAKLYNINQTKGADPGFDNHLRYDGNADGDLKDDPEDYTLYNYYYVVDSTGGDIQLAYQPTIDSTYNNGSTQISNAKNGEVIKIKGSKYVLTDNVTTDADIEIGPAIVKRLGVSVKDPDNAAVVTGTLKMLYAGGKLVMYDGKSLLDEPTINNKGVNYPYKLTSSDKTSDEYAPYDIFVVKIVDNTAYIAMVEKSQKFKITNEEEGVLGYAKARVGDTDWNTTNVTFLSDTITMVKGDTVGVPDTYYQLKFTTSKGFDILRKKTSAIVSGATVKKATSPGKDFLKADTKIVMSVVGSDIQIEFGSHDLHDNINVDDEFNLTTLTTSNEAKLYLISQNDTTSDNHNNALRYDGNADGDLKDSPEDYTLYTHYYVIDAGAGDIQLAYRPTLDSIYSLAEDNYIEDLEDTNVGAVLKIKGTKYVITDSNTADLDIELGPAIVKKLGNTTKDPDNAVVITGTLKMLFAQDKLVMYDGNSLLDEPVVAGEVYYKLTSSDKTSSEYAPYDIYVINATENVEAKIAMVEKSQKFKIANDEEGVLGYARAKVYDSDWNTTNVTFLGDTITMVKGDTVAVPDTYYQLKFTTSKGFDILRQKTSTVSSGTTLKSTISPGKDFILTGNKIVVTTTGGAGESVPDIKIVDEATADDTMNLVLIGGPVANTMTSTLVENGKSTVDWYTSEGDIEVVTSAFTSGKYGIIVAGNDRTATADAAKALADSL